MESGLLEDDVLRSLRRIIRAVDLYNRKLVGATGVSGPQLLCLRELGAHGPMLAGHLAGAVNLSGATVCGILDRLEQRALIRRERQVSDKRRVMVSLSDAGRETLRDAPPHLHDNFLLRFRALPVGRQAEIDEMLKHLVAMMSADTLDAAPILVPGHSVHPAAPTDSSKA
jgi:DNA-binding MarR family transcriptional regulator